MMSQFQSVPMFCRWLDGLLASVGVGASHFNWLKDQCRRFPIGISRIQIPNHLRLYFFFRFSVVHRFAWKYYCFRRRTRLKIHIALESRWIYDIPKVPIRIRNVSSFSTLFWTDWRTLPRLPARAVNSSESEVPPIYLAWSSTTGRLADKLKHLIQQIQFFTSNQNCELSHQSMFQIWYTLNFFRLRQTIFIHMNKV